MEITAAKTLFRTLMDQHGFVGLDLKTDHAKNRLGYTAFSRQTGEPQFISFSIPVIQAIGEEQARMVALHEIAHAMTGYEYGDAHGPRWLRNNLIIGGGGKRTHTLPKEFIQAVSNYTVKCVAGHEHGHRNRVSKHVGLTPHRAVCVPHRSPVYLVPNR